MCVVKWKLVNSKFYHDIIWERPKANSLKINFDANFDKGGREFSSCIVRDEND